MGLSAEISALLSVQVTKGSDESPVKSDNDNSDGIASKSAKLSKGSGVYLVKIIKSKSKQPGSVQYDAKISCINKKKAQIGANVVIKKNQ